MTQPTKFQSIVGAAVPEDALMTVSIHVCTEADLAATRAEQERILSAELQSTPRFAYLVLEDGPLDDEDMSNLALILAGAIDKQEPEAPSAA